MASSHSAIITGSESAGVNRVSGTRKVKLRCRRGRRRCLDIDAQQDAPARRHGRDEALRAQRRDLDRRAVGQHVGRDNEIDVGGCVRAFVLSQKVREADICATVPPVLPTGTAALRGVRRTSSGWLALAGETLIRRMLRV